MDVAVLAVLVANAMAGGAAAPDGLTSAVPFSLADETTAAKNSAMPGLFELPTTGPLVATDIGDGVWVRPQLDETSITLMLDKVAQWGISNIYVDVFRGGETLFPSKFFPQQSDATERDWLSFIVEQAHERGVRVHGWMQTLRWSEAGPFAATSSSLLRQHPEWADVSRNGDAFAPGSLAIYVSPAMPEVDDRLASMTAELCGYGVDGVNWDEIQYNDRADMGYHPLATADFRGAEGVDPHAVEPDMARDSSWMRWTLYREDKLTSLVQQLTQVCRAEGARQGRRIMTSVVVQPGYEQSRGANSRFQHWGEWVRTGLLDATTPGCFDGDLPALEKQLWEVRSIHMGGDVACVPGFMLDRGGFGPLLPQGNARGGSGAHPSLADQKRLLRNAGFQFCTIMDYDALAAEKLRGPEKPSGKRGTGIWGLFSRRED